MKLYMHPASPNVRVVLMTAEILGVPIETRFVDAMAGEQSTPEYLTINPNGLFPVLVDGDFVLWETVAISQYLGSMVPDNPLWPADERRRADITRWQCWALAHWSPAVQKYIFENLFKRLKGLGQPDADVLRQHGNVVQSEILHG